MMRKMIFAIIAVAVGAAFVFSSSFATAADRRTVDLGVKALGGTKSEISINLGLKLDSSTVNSATVTVRNSKGWPVRLVIGVSKDSVLTVKPVYRYLSDDTYTLSISPKVRFSDGKSIGSTYTVEFFVDKTGWAPSVIGSRQNLISVLAAMNSVSDTQDAYLESDRTTAGMQPASEASGAAGSGNGTKAIDYSGTNVQVKGVDEADIVKTDGSFLYYVANNSLYMVRTDRGGAMSLVDAESFQSGESPREAYLNGRTLTLITTKWEASPYGRSTDSGVSYDYSPIYYNPAKAITSMHVFDVSSGKNLKHVRTASVEGDYLTSRMIAGTLHLIANQRINYYAIMRGDTGSETPSYFDSLGKGEWVRMPYSSVRYFRDSRDMSYMNVATLAPSDGTKKMTVESYLGSGDVVYCSTGRLYVANNRSNWRIMPALRTFNLEGAPNNPIAPTPVILPEPPVSESTDVYSFKLDKNGVIYAAKGQVPGTVLNQFSMDESKGSFRIATTKGNSWFGPSNSLTSNVYVLNDRMKITGRLEGLAPGEKIYSARFMGDRAYLVTFRTVDPLFAIDLKDPYAPKVIGILKIPGVSDYLHPYDESHIIGFGREAVERDVKGADGSVVDKVAYYLGMKVALFDVSDPANPKVMHSLTIGDRGTYSNLMYDHKALLFSKEKGVMAFPVDVYEVAQGGAVTYDQSVPEYGKFKYQGEYVYDVSLDKGFRLLGTVTHMSGQELLDSRAQGYNSHYDKSVVRGIYIGDILYTFSGAEIMSNSLDGLRLIDTLKLVE